MRLDGKVALVTGGASGIGAATTRRLSELGADVWMGDLRDPGPELRDRWLKLDVASASGWRAAAERVARESGALHVLVNAAGVTGGGPSAGVRGVTLDDWRRVMAVNVEGVLLGCQTALEFISAGAVVNVCSTVARSPTPALAAYGASKAAVLQLTTSFAAEAAMSGSPVRFNAVLPGMCETPLIAGMDPAYRALWEGTIPMGRFAEPAEIAEVIAFLAGEGSSYMTGAAIPVDGGFLARPSVRP